MKAADQSAFRGYISEFDGLRAIGMAMVLSTHLWPEHRLSFLFNITQMNWFAMDCFFALSGFLIAGILLDSRERKTYFSTFYVRRSLRIFPLYYAVLLFITAHLIVPYPWYSTFTHRWASPLWFFFYLGNLPTAVLGRWPPTWEFSHLWSLQVEEQFYLLLPLAIRYLTGRALKYVLWAMVFLCPLLRVFFYLAAPDNPHPQFVLLVCRMDSLALGALIALRYRLGTWQIARRPLTILVCVSVGAFFTVASLGGFDWHSGLNRTVGLTLSAWASALVVLWLICYRNSRFTKYLRLPPLLYFGRISYGVYLIHIPLIAFLDATSRKMGWQGFQGFPRLFIGAGAAIAVASLSWYFFEKPILSLKDRFTESKLKPAQRDPDPLVRTMAAS
jgi:peptidoglycan/LPS O-acetylase OafA/YrhL